MKFQLTVFKNKHPCCKIYVLNTTTIMHCKTTQGLLKLLSTNHRINIMVYGNFFANTVTYCFKTQNFLTANIPMRAAFSVLNQKHLLCSRFLQPNFLHLGNKYCLNLIINLKILQVKFRFIFALGFTQYRVQYQS